MNPPAWMMRSRRSAVHDQVAHDGKRARPPRLHPDLLPVAEAPHVELAGRGSPVRSVGDAVDHQAAGSADPLAAVVIEGDGQLAPLHEPLVDDVEHLQERHVGADVAGLVAHHRPRRRRSTAGARRGESDSFSVLTCSCAGPGARARTPAAPCAGAAPRPGRRTPTRPRRRSRSSSRSASPVLRLVLLAEVPAAGLLAVQRVAAHQLRQLQEVGHAPGALQRLVQLGVAARHVHVAPELLAELRDPLDAPRAGPPRSGPSRTCPT